MKVSLICTVYNEAKSIHEFLASIAKLKRLPDELVVVDAGSKDGTLEQLHQFAAGVSFPVKILVEKGCNIARGRNIATMNASYEIVAVTDAGCRLDKHWLGELCEPFILGATVVSGWYEPDIRTDFEFVAAYLTFPKIGTIDEREFLPSSRSLAYKKAAWVSVGGYPEWLTFAGEDTLFDLNLLRKGYHFVFRPSAVVYWRPRGNLWSFIKQWYLYGIGDGEARQNIIPVFKIAAKILFFLIFIIFLYWIYGSQVMMVFAIAGLLFKFRKLGKFRMIPMAAAAWVGMRCGYVVGYFSGLLSNKRRLM